MNPFVNIVPIVIVLIVAVIVLVYLLFPSIKGLHFTSLLHCPKCDNRFEYRWLPGGSFDSIRWGNYRYILCPRCGNRSWFDIWSTRINED